MNQAAWLQDRRMKKFRDVLSRWEAGELSMLEAGELLGMSERQLDLMRTSAIVKVPSGADFSYDGADADFRLRKDLDRLNFSELEPGALFGTLGNGCHRHLDVTLVGDGASKTPYFEYGGGDIRLSQRAIPAMLTLDPMPCVSIAWAI